MDPSVFFIQGLGAHRAYGWQLSTEDLELQLENLGKVDEAAATLLQRNAMEAPAHPDLVPAPVQDQLDLERPFQLDVLGVDPERGRRKLDQEAALPLLDLMQFQFHGLL